MRGMTAFAITVAAMTVMACDDNPLAPSDVVGTTWRLVGLQEAGSNPITVDDPTRYTLRLEQESRVAVVSDCNSCGGAYSLTGSALELGPIACTKVFCGDTSPDQKFARALEQARTVSVDDARMTIHGEGVTLQFAR